MLFLLGLFEWLAVRRDISRTEMNNQMKKRIQSLFLKSFGLKPKQPDPIDWRIKSKMLSFNLFEVHITAVIEYPWRLYSQKSSSEGPLPTRVRFNENSYIILIGDTKEVGTVKEDYDHFYNSITHFYTSVVDFVQEVTAFTKPETLKGKIVYMVGTDRRYLNPKEITFQIELTN